MIADLTLPREPGRASWHSGFRNVAAGMLVATPAPRKQPSAWLMVALGVAIGFGVVVLVGVVGR